ncbi:DNA topoisomerase, partial [Pseudomonas sp. FW305-3-2-15-C-LB1]
RLARVVKACQDLPGQRLFQYIDDEGERRAVESADVNAYLREAIGEDFSAKDFRTWAGTVNAARALTLAGAFENATDCKRRINT